MTRALMLFIYVTDFCLFFFSGLALYICKLSDFARQALRITDDDGIFIGF